MANFSLCFICFLFELFPLKIDFMIANNSNLTDSTYTNHIYSKFVQVHWPLSCWFIANGMDTMESEMSEFGLPLELKSIKILIIFTQQQNNWQMPTFFLPIKESNLMLTFQIFHPTHYHIYDAGTLFNFIWLHCICTS